MVVVVAVVVMAVALMRVLANETAGFQSYSPPFTTDHVCFVSHREEMNPRLGAR